MIHRPSFKEKFFFFIAGAIISTPFPLVVDSTVRLYLTGKILPLTATLITSAFIAPFLEEFAKAFPLFYRHGETEKSLIQLGFLTGLGFGITEFILYVFVLHVPAELRLTALLFHATNTTIVAYGIAKKEALKYYLLAVVLHLINNLSAFYGNFWFIGGATALFTSYFLATFVYRHSKEQFILE